MINVEQSVEWELAGETEVLGENLPQCHFVNHKSHITWPGLEPVPPRFGSRQPALSFVHNAWSPCWKVTGQTATYVTRCNIWSSWNSIVVQHLNRPSVHESVKNNLLHNYKAASRDKSVGIRFSAGARDFLSYTASRQALGLHHLSLRGRGFPRRLSCQGAKLSDHVHVVRKYGV
jgi:hypothetical protein